MEENIKQRRPFVIVTVSVVSMAYSLNDMYDLIRRGFITVRWV